MISYLNIVDALQQIVDDHLILNHFAAGPLDEVDINKLAQTQYPFLYCEILGVSIDHGILTYDVELLVADMILPDLTDRNQVYSDTLQLLHDVLNQYIQVLNNNSLVHPSGTGREGTIKIELPATCTPFTTRFDNHLTGWSGQFSIEVDNINNLCISPIA